MAEETNATASSEAKKPPDAAQSKKEKNACDTKVKSLPLKKEPEPIKKPQRPVHQPSPQEIILAATTLSLLLAEGKSKYEVETLINLLSLTSRNLQSVLTQILINEKTPDQIDILI